MVIWIELRILESELIAIENEAWDDYRIQYLKCRADLNFEVDFRINGATAIVTKWDLILLKKIDCFYP